MSPASQSILPSETPGSLAFSLCVFSLRSQPHHTNCPQTSHQNLRLKVSDLQRLSSNSVLKSMIGNFSEKHLGLDEWSWSERATRLTTLKGCFPLKRAYGRRCGLNSIITRTIIIIFMDIRTVTNHNTPLLEARGQRQHKTKTIEWPNPQSDFPSFGCDSSLSKGAYGPCCPLLW